MAGALWAFVFVSATQGQPVRCTTADGKTAYLDATDAQALNCRPLKAETTTIEPQPGTVRVVPFNQPPKPSAAGPRPGQIEAAEKKLAEAKKSLADQESIRSGNEKNYARVLERLKPYQDAVATAEQELAKLKAAGR